MLIEFPDILDRTQRIKKPLRLSGMKKAAGFLVLLSGLMPLFAQQEGVLKVNLTDPLAGRYSMGYERGVLGAFSVGLDIDYLSREVFLESDHPWYEPLNTQKQGVILEPQLRWYPGGEALKGSYAAVGGFFGVARYTPAEGGLDNDDWSSVGASLQLGHQLSLGRFVLDGFIGGTWAADDYPGPYYESTALFPPPQGLRFSGGLRFGIRL